MCTWRQRLSVKAESVCFTWCYFNVSPPRSNMYGSIEAPISVYSFLKPTSGAARSSPRLFSMWDWHWTVVLGRSSRHCGDNVLVAKVNNTNYKSQPNIVSPQASDTKHSVGNQLILRANQYSVRIPPRWCSLLITNWVWNIVLALRYQLVRVSPPSTKSPYLALFANHITQIVYLQ